MTSIEYHHVDGDDNELTLLVEFDYIPGDPGRLNARWEDCYPATDPEIEITSISLLEASTPQSRQHSRYRGIFNFRTPAQIIINALEQCATRNAQPESVQPVNTDLYYDRNSTLNALNQGGFIGPAQQLIPVEISDLLSNETLNDIEAECWAAQ